MKPWTEPASLSIRSIDRTGLWQRRTRPTASSRRDERLEHVGGPVRDREDLAVALDLGRDARRLEHPDRRVDVEAAATPGPGTHRCRRTPLDGPDAAAPGGIVGRVDRARHGVEPAQAAGIGDIAPGAAGHQDLDPGPAVLLEQDHPCTALGGPDGGDQARGPRPRTATS